MHLWLLVEPRLQTLHRLLPTECRDLGGPLRKSNFDPGSFDLLHPYFFTSAFLTVCSGGPGPATNGWGSAPAFTPRAQGGGSWDAPPPRPQQRNFDANSYGAPRGEHRGYGEGRWVDGKHVPGAPNARLERELFGSSDPNARTTQTTGINFDKYDDIPVEASGHDVPEAVTEFTCPPLDDHLISNITLAGYKNPTPVQKYSIPIVMGGRDLMACAQTGMLNLSSYDVILLLTE